MNAPPTFVIRLDRLANADTRTAAERAVLLAAIRWANADGELWPSMENWARLAGVKVRTLQRVLGRLVEAGIVEVIDASNGGANRTTRYRVPMLLANPDVVSGGEPRPARHETPTPTPANPDGCDTKPRRGVTQSSREQPNERPSTPAGVVSGLSPDLQRHRNATPERLAWIEREAPSKDNPAAWASACIREGWDPPPPTAAQTAATAKADRESRLAAFDAMTDEQRAAILADVFRVYPNLIGRPASDPAVRGGALKVMARDELAQTA